MARFICGVCGYAYEGGELPADFVCPMCGAGAEAFRQEQTQASAEGTQSMYLILGSGAAAVSAAEAIREADATGAVTMISDDVQIPYLRPMLTKSDMRTVSAETIAVHPDGWYAERSIVRYFGHSVASMDTAAHTVALGSGESFMYDKCIYALGSHSFVPPIPGSDSPRVTTLRTVQDVTAIGALAGAGKRAVIVGGGVLGLETAWMLRRAGCEVCVIEASAGVLSGKAAPEASAELASIAAGLGVGIVTNGATERIDDDGTAVWVVLKDGRNIPADLVVLSCGVRANIEIASAAGIAVDRSVVVDAYMRTSAPDVYACGDCAQLDGVNYCLWSQSTAQGRVAGLNAAGGSETYANGSPALTMHAFDTALFAVGDNRSDDCETEVLRTGGDMAVYRRRGGRLVGATLLGSLDAMQEVVREIQG